MWQGFMFGKVIDVFHTYRQYTWPYDQFGRPLIILSAVPAQNMCTHNTWHTLVSIFECFIKPNVTMIQIETHDCLVSRVRSVRCISSKATYHTQWFVKFKARKLTRGTREGLFQKVLYACSCKEDQKSYSYLPLTIKYICVPAVVLIGCHWWAALDLARDGIE